MDYIGGYGAARPARTKRGHIFGALGFVAIGIVFIALKATVAGIAFIAFSLIWIPLYFFNKRRGFLKE